MFFFLPTYFILFIYLNLFNYFYNYFIIAKNRVHFNAIIKVMQIKWSKVSVES